MCGRYFALYREQGDAELDDLEEVDVAAYCLVVVGGFRVELSDRSCDNAGEFCVLRRCEYRARQGITDQRRYPVRSPRRPTAYNRLHTRMSDTCRAKGSPNRFVREGVLTMLMYGY